MTEELLPRVVERLGAFALQLVGERGDVEAGLGEARQHGIAVAAVGGHALADLAVLVERDQRLVRHGVDGERRRQAVDIEGVGLARILGARARPQEPLHARAAVLEALPALGVHELPIGAIDVAADGERRADLLLAAPAGTRGLAALSQRDMNTDATEPTLRIEPGGDAPLDAAQVRLGGGAILRRRRTAASR